MRPRRLLPQAVHSIDHQLVVLVRPVREQILSENTFYNKVHSIDHQLVVLVRPGWVEKGGQTDAGTDTGTDKGIDTGTDTDTDIDTDTAEG